MADFTSLCVTTCVSFVLVVSEEEDSLIAVCCSWRIRTMSVNYSRFGKSEQIIMTNTKEGTYRIKICTKTTRQELSFCQKARYQAIPSSELFSLLQSQHDSGATVFQITIGWASARRYDVCWVINPFETFQIDNVYAGDTFFHVRINSSRDNFVNDENVVSKCLEKCTLRNQTYLSIPSLVGRLLILFVI